MVNRLSGIVIPAILPLESSGSPDFPSLQKLLAHAFDKGIQGCWVNGTSGGFHYASDATRECAIEASVEVVAGRFPVIAHIGDTSLERAKARAVRARELGATHVAAITPYYLELERSELEAFYRQIASAVGGPIFLYQHPATGIDGLAVDDIVQLAHEGVVCGIKESGTDLAYFESLCAAVARAKIDFTCMHGAGATALQSLSSGGDGLVTVAANILPRTMSALFTNFECGAIEEVHRYQEAVLEVTSAIKNAMPNRRTGGSVVTAYAYLLKELGIFETATVSEPLKALDATEMKALSNEVIPLIESAEQVAASCADANA